ncbi:hypothetical protein H6G69_20055 [Nostoc sp. FACHB-110]|nr:hypothetical protein [Nostoc sp. FACHB-110]
MAVAEKMMTKLINIDTPGLSTLFSVRYIRLFRHFGKAKKPARSLN